MCPPLYTIYNNSRSRKELCTRMRIPVVYWHGPPPLPFAVPRILLLFLPPDPLFFNCLTLLLAISPRLLFVASSNATVNHSACDCVRLITVIRPFLVPVYRPLIIIIDFSSVHHFLVFLPASLPFARMYERTDRGETARKPVIRQSTPVTCVSLLYCTGSVRDTLRNRERK